MTTERKCYNCTLDPNTCLYRCGLAREDWDYLSRNKGVSQELAILAARATKLALQKAIDDMTDLQNEIRTLELELKTLLELGDDDVYTRHCTYLHDDPVDPYAIY